MPCGTKPMAMLVAGSCDQAPPSEPIGTRDMLSTPPATTMSSQPLATFCAAMFTASSPEAQKRLICTPATFTSQPALSAAVLAITEPCSPTGETTPMTTSSSAAGSKPWRFCSFTSRPASRSTGFTSCRLPSFLPLPRGVRTASKIIACVMVVSRIDRPLSDWANSPSSLPSKRLVDPFPAPPMPAYRSVFRADLFAGQVALVTGGGSGIGRCTAHELASLGARVAIVGRTLEKLEAVQREIEDAGGSCTVHAADIRDEAMVKATVAAVLEAHGRIDALVNNAGGQFPSPLAAISAKGWDAVVRNNLTGGFLMARECITQWMLEDDGSGAPRGGAIVNIIADMWNGMPGMGHSGAARAGMLNFTETAALEWAPVRVNAVAPGWIASSGLDRYPPEMRRTFRGLHALVPLRRPRHRERGRGGDRLPAFAGGGVRLGQLPARRRRGAERQADLARGRHRRHDRGVQRLSSRLVARRAEGPLMPALLPALDGDAESRAAQRSRTLALIERWRAIEARTRAASERAGPLFAKRGQLLPRERVARLLDPGIPFLELSTSPAGCSTATIPRSRCRAAASSPASASSRACA
jgi:citronellol/citronellal dehydrogenase